MFEESPGGLYFHDTKNRKLSNTFENDPAVSLVETVKNNLSKFTKRQIERAKTARRAYGMVGRPSPRDFRNMIRGHMINNCPVTTEDIDNADIIYGPDVPALKGKTVRTQSQPVTTDVVKIPPEILSLHKNVTLTGDVMFVNGIPFLVTLSRN